MPERTWSLLGRLLGLLGKEHSLDVGQYATLSNGDTRQQLVQLLVVTDSELKVTWDDSALLVVTCSVSCQLEDLSSEVLHDGSKVNGGTSTHSLGVVALSQVPVDSSHWELESSPAAAGLGLALCFASFTSSRHVE